MSHFKKRMVTEDDDGEERASKSDKKRRRMIDEEDDESEDGEVAEPSRQADEDYDSADEYDDEGYKGAEDRQKLFAMNVLARETILTERLERKERRFETLQIRQKMRERQQGQPAEKARKASDRGRAAASAAEVQKNKIKELAARREEANRKERERVAAAREEEAEADEADEGELPEAMPAQRQESRLSIEGDGEVRNTAEGSREVAAPVAQLERIRLKRDQLEKWLNEPFFERVLPGCFVRIGIGNKDGLPIYRVAEIVQVKDNFRPYTVGQKLTSKRLELQVGRDRKWFQISYVSNANFGLDELDKFHRIIAEAKIDSKTHTQIEEKIKDLVHHKTGYAYTKEELDAKVKAEQKSLKSAGNLPLRRAEANEELRLAKDAGDAERVGLAEAELKLVQAEVDKEKRRDQQRAGSSFRIQDINVRNADFMRQIEQKAGARDLKDEKDISAGRVRTTDPFKRLPIRPVIYWNVAGTDEPPAAAPAPTPAPAPPPSLVVDVPAVAASSGVSLVSPGFASLVQTPTGDTPREAEAAAAAEAEAEGLSMAFEPLGEGAVAHGGAKLPKPKRDAAAPKLPTLQGKRAAAHEDVDIDIDIDEPPAAPPRKPMPYAGRPTMPPPPAPSDAPPRATLSVTDYKRRMGIL